MKYTIQTVSNSGSFAIPYGDDCMVVVGRDSVARALEAWERAHRRVGSDDADASILVWKGALNDVTDQYPDYEVKRGPRGGVIWHRC